MLNQAHTPSFRPRQDRDKARGDALAARMRAQGRPAMEVALACVEVQFGPAYRINNEKRTVERLIRKSYGHPEVRARFRYYAAIFCEKGMGLDAACGFIAAECAKPRLGERIALPGMIRREMNLTLRWLRRMKMHGAFAEMVAAERRELLRRHLGAMHQSERVLEAAE